MNPITGFMIKAINTFHVRTLTSIGFNTRVVLNNASDQLGDIKTEFRVDISVFSKDGKEVQYIENIAILPPASSLPIDCCQWQLDSSEDNVLIFHMIPMSMLKKSNAQDNTDIDFKDLISYANSTDHYVEYYLESGYSAGVLYQCAPYNYSKFNKGGSTLVQAPKIYLDNKIDTFLSLFYTSPVEENLPPAKIKFIITSEDGLIVDKWEETIDINTTKLISFQDKLKNNANLSFKKDSNQFTLLALSEKSIVVPLIINQNKEKKSIAIEHSLPPQYYAKNLKGKIRRNIISDLVENSIFTN